MPTLTPSNPPDRSPSVTQIMVVIAVLFLLIGIVVSAISANPTQKTLINKLLLGWLIFPISTWPRITLDLDGIAAFLITFLMLALLAHFFFAWLYSAFRPPASPILRWKTRWTIILSGSLILLFALTVSLTAITHNTLWLLTPANITPKLTHRPYPPDLAMYFQVQDIARLLNPKTSRASSQTLLAGVITPPSAYTYLEHTEFGFISRPDGSLYAAYILPRDPVQRARLGICVLTTDPDAPQANTAEEIQQRLTNAANWPALLHSLNQKAHIPAQTP